MARKPTPASKTPRSDASKATLSALRRFGYRGPVDQDGNKVTDTNAWTTTQLRAAGSQTR